jgi:SAM-dependent methyltransferase
VSGWKTPLYKVYWKLEQAICPGLKSSQYAYYEALAPYLENRPAWLDLGCGHQMFAHWMTREQNEAISRAGTIVGMDYDHASLRKNTAIRLKSAGDVRRLPFRDRSFDLVTANMVVEHLDDPAASLAEIRRVLRPGGIFIYHTPNYWSYWVFLCSMIPDSLKLRLIRLLDGRPAEDVFPTRYRLNTPRAAARFAFETGFRLREMKLVSTSAGAALIPPLAFLELLLIRLLTLDRFAKFRTNIVAVYEKPVAARRAA